LKRFLYSPSAGITRIRFNGYHLRQGQCPATPNLYSHLSSIIAFVNCAMKSGLYLHCSAIANQNEDRADKHGSNQPVILRNP